MAMKPTDAIVGAPRGTAAQAIAALDGPDAKDVEFVTALFVWSKEVGIDPSIMVAQVYHESGRLTSPRWNHDLNPSGLGITGDDVPQPFVITSGQDAALIHLQAVAMLLGFDVPWAVPEAAERWLDTVWKRHCDAAPPVKTIANLSIRYPDPIRGPGATWAWDARYGAKVVGIGNAVFPDLPDQESPGGTPMPDIVYGRVPHPAYQDRIVANSTAWNDLGNRIIRGGVWHRMLGTLVGTDGYFRGAARTRALTDYGVGVGIDGENDGVVFRWNDPRSRRSPWANGPVSGPYGDGKAFIDRYGVNATQRDLVSIEISGQQATPLTEPSRQAIAALTAYWADQYRVPHTDFPAVPNEGRSFVIWHEELTFGTGKRCPFEVVKAETDALIERTKAILKRHQELNFPVPLPPPPPPKLEYPAYMDKGVASRWFGTVTGEDGKTYVFDEEGPVSKIWLAQGEIRAAFPMLEEVQVYDNGARRYFRFDGGWTLFVGADGIPVVVKD